MLVMLGFACSTQPTHLNHTYQNQINPVSGAGADISVGKKILALIAASANKKISRMMNGPTFWRKKVMVS